MGVEMSHPELTAVPAAQREVRIKSSVLSRAKRHDAQAIATMFGQFLPQDERIFSVEYLGVQGLWLGTHSFACVTNRRVAALRVKIFGAVEYQDGTLEHVNSGVVRQPSLLLLYLWIVGVSIVTLGIGLLLLPLTVRLFYRFKKSGLVLAVREGIGVYVFCDRKLVMKATELYRTVAALREGRIAEVRGLVARAYVAPGSESASGALTPERAGSAEGFRSVATQPLLLAAALLTLIGSILLVLGMVLPVEKGADGSTYRLLHTNRDLWFALPALFCAAAAAIVGLFVLLRPSRRLLTSGLLIGVGLAAAVYFLGYVGFSVSLAGVSPGMGGYLGLIGGAIVLASGLSRIPAR
jgi:hypothetical protein